MRSSLLATGSLIAAAAAAGCGEPPSEPTTFDLGVCGVVEVHPRLAAPHRPQDTLIEWPTNPPASGPHYPLWAAWDRSYTVLQRGNWLHNAEHGGVVLAYRCDAGCPGDIAALEDVVRGLPVDPLCAAPVRQRALVVADPLLPVEVRVAAIAWGVTYTADCVDPEALTSFIGMHYARGPENLCAQGAGLGGTLIE